MLLTSQFCFSSLRFPAPLVKPNTIRHVPCKASLITDSNSFEVGKLIGSYGFMNVTSYRSGRDVECSPKDLEALKLQDVGEGSVKIRLYEGRIAQGPLKQTPVTFKVYPGQKAGGEEADRMAANELNAHLSLQSDSKELCPNLVALVGGFETKTGEQWLAFRDHGQFSAADYAKFASDRVTKQRDSGWNLMEKEQSNRRRRYFVTKLMRGAISGLTFMHDRDRLHQSLGPFSVSLNSMMEKDANFLVPRLRDLAFSVDVKLSSIENEPGMLSEGLWRRAVNAGAYSVVERRAFGFADDIYEAALLFAFLAFVPFCETGSIDNLSLQRIIESTFRLDLDAAREYFLADDRFEEAVKFLDLGDKAGWQLLQAMLNPDFRQRPIAEAVLNHRFLTGAVL